jgi:hypothetical protein
LMASFVLLYGGLSFLSLFFSTTKWHKQLSSNRLFSPWSWGFVPKCFGSRPLSIVEVLIR